MYFLVALSHSGEDDLFSREAASVCVKYFVAAYTVCTESLCAYLFKQPAFHVCLDGIVYLDVVFFRYLFCVCNSTSEQVDIVIIKWGCYTFELFYCVDIQHLNKM